MRHLDLLEVQTLPELALQPTIRLFGDISSITSPIHTRQGQIPPVDTNSRALVIQPGRPFDNSCLITPTPIM